jgi:hypothetical protein
MRHTYGPRRLKWALDWPVTILRSPSVYVDPPVTIPNVKVELVLLAGAIVLVLAGVTFHTTFGF